VVRHEQAHRGSIVVGEAWNRAKSGSNEVEEASYCFKKVKNQQILRK
jgi:hypothetical protein